MTRITYLAGVDLLTAEGIVVGTHDGCFSCGTGAGVGLLAVDCIDSMFRVTILARSARVGHVISGKLSASKRVAAWQMVEKGKGAREEEQEHELGD